MSAMSAIGAMSGFGSISGYYSIYHNRNANPIGTQAVERVSRVPTAPVPPVRGVPTVHRGSTQSIPEKQDSPVQFPTLREGADPAEMAVRARIQYLDEQVEGLEQDLLGWNQSKGLDELLSTGRKQESGAIGQTLDRLNASQEENSQTPQEIMEEAECQTCKNRKYQDGSDDPGVSFKTATNVAPELAASAVRGHEQEHVVREQAKAQREDRKVVSQSVTLHTDICPECGDVFISGGTTRTTTKANPVQEPRRQEAEQMSLFQAFA